MRKNWWPDGDGQSVPVAVQREFKPILGGIMQFEAGRVATDLVTSADSMKMIHVIHHIIFDQRPVDK